MSREYQATAAAESGAGPVADYQFRVWITKTTQYLNNADLLQVPSPPHITVPPFCDEAAPVLPPYVGYNQGHGDEILKHVTQGNYQVETTEWKYPWRREAQAILAFLYLGPASIARNMDFLKKEGITMLLVVRDSVSAAQGLYNGQKAADELGIPSIFINVTNNQDLIRAFPVAIEKINQHLEEEFLKQGGLHKPQNQVPGKPNTWGKILVFCESGNERSPAVVAAYLMAMYHIDLIAAIQYIQQRRFCVSIFLVISISVT